MKVTKYIREYVENEVSRIYDAKKNPFAESLERDNLEIEAFNESIRQEVVKRVQEFADQHGFVNYAGKPYVADKSVNINLGGIRSKSSAEYLKWNGENRKEKADKVRDILISLELGATKSELTDMIAALTQEV